MRARKEAFVRENVLKKSDLRRAVVAVVESHPVCVVWVKCRPLNRVEVKHLILVAVCGWLMKHNFAEKTKK